MKRLTSLMLSKKEEPSFDTTFTKQNLLKLRECQYYRFIRFPWMLWFFSSFFLGLAIYLTYVIMYEEAKSNLTVTINIALYYVYFIMVYMGKIEKLTVNKKKGIIKLSKYNIFLSKTEKVQKIDDVKDIEIIKKGVERRGLDTTKFYIRITFPYNIKFDFGETVQFYTIQEKYKEVVALIKEVIIPKNLITREFITDETVLEDDPFVVEDEKDD